MSLDEYGGMMPVEEEEEEERLEEPLAEEDRVREEAHAQAEKDEIERLEASTTNFIDDELFNQIKDLINQYEYDAELWQLWTTSAQGGENISNQIYFSLNDLSI